MSGAGVTNAAIQQALLRAKQLAANSEQIKRPADGDTDGENPAKRANNGDGGVDMAGNPIATLGSFGGIPPSGLVPGGVVPAGAAAGGEPVMIEQFEVPDSTVGLIIGRGGEQITAIQAQTGCRVQMAPEPNGSSTRPCTLQGSKQAIEDAKAMISDVINRSGGRPPPGKLGGPGPGGLGGAPGVSGGNYVTEDMFVPGNKCGLIIGKGGETIKQLQVKTGCKIALIQDSTVAGNLPKPLRISGEPGKVAAAKQVINELVNKEQQHQGGPMNGGGGPYGGGGGGGPYGGGGGGGGGGHQPYGMPRSIGEVIVPRSSVGIIIGKGGETIRRLNAETGAKIQFKQDEDPQGPERTAVIQGTPEQIDRATKMISDLVNKTSDNADVFYMHIPSSKCGLVIGRGGETIKAINGESGAHVELNRQDQPNPNEKVFVIKGSPYQIHHAQHIIRIKVGDIPPGTPLGPMPGAMHPPVPPHPHHPHHTHHPSAAFNNHPHHPGAPPPGAPGHPQHPHHAPHQQQQQQQPFPPHPQQPQAPVAAAGGYPGAAPGAPGSDPNAAAWAQYYGQQQPGGAPPGAPAGAPNPYGAPAPGAAAVATNPYGQPSNLTPTSQPYQQQQQPNQGQHAAAVQQQAQAQAQAQAPGSSSAAAAGQAGAPAINPQTGQPDYSAQWAEYYRSLGMHDQAAAIEQQAKANQLQQPGGAAGGPGGTAGGSGAPGQGAPAPGPGQQQQQPGLYGAASGQAPGGSAGGYGAYGGPGAGGGNNGQAYPHQQY